MAFCDDIRLGDDGKRLCGLDGCPNAYAAKGWCFKHYHRVRKWGDPHKTYYRDTCTIDDCDRRHVARGYCRLHWDRWSRLGDPLGTKLIYHDDEKRILDKIDASGDCWEWTGGISQQGYGKVKLKGRTLGAHRVVWELLVGDIPEGLTLDHLCRNTACVKPDHLEPVTIRENVLRGYGAAAQKMRKAGNLKG